MAELELWALSLRRANLIELAEAAARAGFSYVTASPRILAATPVTGSTLRRRIEDCGVKVSVIEGLLSVMPGMGPHSSPPVEDFIRMAHDLGATRIGAAHWQGGPQTVEETAASLDAACRRLAPEGLELAVEFITGTAVPDLATCLAILGDAPNGGVLFDNLHFLRSGGQVEELTPQVARRIRAVQLSDRSADQDLLPYTPVGGRKIPGEGDFPLPQIIAPILAAQPDLPIGAEVISEELDALPFDVAAQAIANGLREVIAQI